jgi:YegS/Rv2252/BmrU family lipid kinase
MKKGIFIYNPNSGGQDVAENLDFIVGKFQSNDIIIQPYRLNSDNEKLLHIIKSASFDLAVISGGDGTLHTIINMFLKNNIHIPIGVIPAGTCNDFARCLEVPDELEGAIDIIISGKTIDVDVGLINNKTYFLDTCAGGLFVDVSYSTDSELKQNFGPLAYYLQGLTQLANISPFSLTVSTPDRIIKEDVLLFLLLNGKHGAGLSHLLREADLSDGIFDIVLIKNCSHIDLASLFFRIMNNELLDDENVISFKSANCTFETDRDVPLTFDGEKAEGLPLSIKCIPKALKVFVG